MRNRVVTSAIIGALIIPVGFVATAGSADATTYYYPSCSLLTVKFHHGVSKSRIAALKQVAQGYGMPAYGPLAQKVYWKNHSRLDRDNDGTACER